MGHYGPLVVKSDSEPSLVSLLEKMAHLRDEEVKEDIITVLEQSPVGGLVWKRIRRKGRAPTGGDSSSSQTRSGIKNKHEDTRGFVRDELVGGARGRRD